MKFNEEKASEIVKNFGLSEKTIAVWRTRGKIPDRYFKDGFTLEETAESKEWKRVQPILKSEKINFSELARLTEIPKDRLNYLKKNNARPGEIVAIKKAVNEVRVELKKIDFDKLQKGIDTEEKAFLKLHANKLLVWNVILNRTEVNKTLASMRFGTVKNFPIDQCGFIQSCIAIFLLETQM